MKSTYLVQHAISYKCTNGRYKVSVAVLGWYYNYSPLSRPDGLGSEDSQDSLVHIWRGGREGEVRHLVHVWRGVKQKVKKERW